MKDRVFTFDDMNKLARYITDNFKIDAWTNTRNGDSSKKNVPYYEIVNEFIKKEEQLNQDYNEQTN